MRVNPDHADFPALLAEVLDLLAFAKRATRWEQDTVVSRRMAFDHYWGPNGVAAKL